MSAASEYSGSLISPDAERAVLGAVLLDNTAWFQVGGILRPEDFGLDSHRTICAHMAEMVEEYIPVDLVTLCERLHRNGVLDAVGGGAYVSSITDGLPRVSNIGHYVALVKEKSDLRRLIETFNAGILKATEGIERPATIASEVEQAILQIGGESAKGELVQFGKAFEAHFGSIDQIQKKGTAVAGVKTGFRDLDAMTSGLHSQELIIIGGRPGQGKSSMSLDIARHAAGHEGKHVALFSLEMSRAALVLRALCAQADVDSHRIETSFMSREDWLKLGMAFGRFRDAPLWIDDTAGIGLAGVRAKAQRMKKERGLDLLIVDYLQLMSTAGRAENRTQEVSALSRGLKALAKDLDVPVIALSALKRQQGREGRPQLQDLRESGGIESDADVVLLLWREELVSPTEHNRGLAECIVAKSRNGPVGTVGLVFLAQYSSFRNAPDKVNP